MSESLSGTAALPPLPAYKNRRGWLIAFGIVEILIACFFLLMAVFMAVLIPNMPMQPGQPPMPAGFFYVISFFYGMIGAVFATAGIGSIQARNWARILMIVLSSLWLVFGVFGTVISAVMIPVMARLQETILQQNPATQDAQLPPNFMSIVMVISLIFQILTMVLLPLIFLLFYTRKNVSMTCKMHSAAAGHYLQTSFAPLAPSTAAISGAPVSSVPAKGLPVPIIVAIVCFVFLGVSKLMGVWLPITLLFGVTLHGAVARLAVIALASVDLYCAWSFYRLQIQGWWTAIAVFVFSILSGIVTLIKADLKSFYDEVYRQMGIDPQQAGGGIAVGFWFQPHLMHIFMALGWLIWAAFFVFLLYTKRYFRTGQEKANG